MTAEAAFSAFSRVEFHSVFDLQQVWMPRPASHLPLQQRALQRFAATLEHAGNLRSGGHPLGLCCVGPAGSGKTHLLGEFRREAGRQAANFVLSDLTDIRDFWPLLAMHYLQSLQKPLNGVRQVERVLATLLQKADDGVPNTANALDQARSLKREGLVSFASEIVSFLRPLYGEEILKRHRSFRALLYLESDDLDLSERAYSFLQGIEQIDEESQRICLQGPNDAKRVAVDLAWLLGLCGETVLAFDQLDPFVAQNNLAGQDEPTGVREKEALQVLFGVVNGIFAIHQEFSRTLVVLTCLDTSWAVLKKRAVESFPHRFEEVELLQTIRDASTPSDLIGLRLDEAYSLAGFTPPHRTWPFAPSFFSSLPAGLTPRDILNICEKHRLACVRAGLIREIHGCSSEVAPSPKRVLPELDEQFNAYFRSVDAEELLDEAHEDKLGELLGEAARLLRRELLPQPDVDIAVQDDFHETKQYESLHVRCRRIFRNEGDREEHVCVRVLQKNNPRSFQCRLAAALTTSGITEKLDGRRLVLLRNSPPPSGAKTAELVKSAKELGAEFLRFTPEDVRTLAATVEFSKAGVPMFETWLVRNLPLSKTGVFRSLVGSWLEPCARATQSAVAPSAASAEIAALSPTPARRPSQSAHVPTPPGPAAVVRKNVLLGRRLEAGTVGEAVSMQPIDLARHVMIRAGSGGGKTVLVKRLVEESALCGIPSIVIDTAKDLSMMGDRWKEVPPGWNNGDAHLAEVYHTSIDVRIWTPGHPAGRPLRLAPLPNLSGPFAEPHDRDQLIDLAVSSLLPLAVQRKSPKVERAILRKVLEWLTLQPQHGGEVDRLIAALRDLPAETIQAYQNERKLAAGMADQIQAAMAADPLLAAGGEDLDPAVLFGVGGPRTRISVLSLFGMPDFDTQARFIGQLAVALFNWIRRNPAPVDSAARGLLVLDEAARFLPRHTAESKPGLMLLAQQARKYGLGLILATQNPKDLDYNATANFATQLFGTANTTQVVKYIEEAMAQRGLTGMHPGQLTTGQFFCATPALDKPVRLQVPMCLSAHPLNIQLSDDDILARSHR